MVTTRPSDKVVNEVSILTDYMVMGEVMGGTNSSILEVGGKSYAMWGQNNGYWIRNVLEQSLLINTMRVSTDVTIKGRTAEGAAKNETYSLKGFTQALDRANWECR